MVNDFKRIVSNATRRFSGRGGKRTYRCHEEFLPVEDSGWQGCVRRGREIDWRRLPVTLAAATVLKENRVFLMDNMVIKRFPLRFLHADRCLNAYKMAFELQKRAVNTPQNLAYLKYNRYSYYVSAYLADAVTANEYFSAMQADPEHKRRQIRKFARWVSFVHEQDLYQHDFKSCNVLCREGEFYLVDLEGIRLRAPAFNDKIYNLAQLNASMSKFVTLKDRLRFFTVYVRNLELTMTERRAVLQKIWDIMLKKNTAYYDLAPEDLWPLGLIGLKGGH